MKYAAAAYIVSLQVLSSPVKWLKSGLHYGIWGNFFQCFLVVLHYFKIFEIAIQIELLFKMLMNNMVCIAFVVQLQSRTNEFGYRTVY